MLHFLYFSPTGGTRKYVHELMQTVDAQVDDLTLKRDIFTLSLTKEDLLVLAFPVYFGRVPSLLLEKLQGLKGDATPVILLAIYGNRHYDDSIKEAADFLEGKGFIPFAAAALIAKHTYGSIQVLRPDKKDLQEAKAFFEKAKAIQEKKRILFPGSSPYKEGGKPHFFPRTSQDCIGCKACMRACPWDAITQEIITMEDKCSACLACLDVCPMDARVLSQDYTTFAQDFSEKLKEPRENEFFL